jgi:hypothetical protein
MKVVFRSLSPSEIRVLVRFNVGKPKFEIQVNWPAIMLHLNPIEYLWDNITLMLCKKYVCLYIRQSKEKKHIQGISRVIMSPEELEMQPTIHTKLTWLF